MIFLFSFIKNLNKGQRIVTKKYKNKKLIEKSFFIFLGRMVDKPHVLCQKAQREYALFYNHLRGTFDG